MSEGTGGSIDYEVNITSDIERFVQSMDEARSSFEKLYKSVENMSSTIEDDLRKLDDSSQKAADSIRDAGNAAQSSGDQVSKSFQPSVLKLQQLEDTFARVYVEASKLGDTTDSADKLADSMNRFQDSVETGFSSTKEMNEAIASMKYEMQQVEKETNQYNQMFIQMEKSIGAAERKVSDMEHKLISLGATEEELTPLRQALEDYKTSLEDAGHSKRDITGVNEEFKNSLQSVSQQFAKNGKDITKLGNDTDQLQKSFQNTAKAVQLALGPLSGVAARITALSTLVRTNTITIAAFVAGMTSLVVATSQVIKAGIEFERQMLGMEAVLASTGRQAEMTATQLNSIAEGVAESTLSATTATRRAATVLATYSNIASDSFESILVSAQGLASMFGTEIVAATRQMARALEDPVANLDSLRRVGIQFTNAEKEKMRVLQMSGRIMEAQDTIMQQFAAAQRLALKEAEGLAGALDTMGERFQKLKERVAEYTQSNDRLGESVNEVNKTIQKFTMDSGNFEVMMKAVDKTVGVFAGTINMLNGNIEVLLATVAGVFTLAIVKSTIAMTSWALGITGANGALTKLSLAAAAGSTSILATSAAAITASRSFVALGLAMKALPVIAATAVIYSMYKALSDVRGSTETYERSLEELDKTAERSKTMQEQLANAYRTTGEAAAKSLRDAQNLARQGLATDLTNVIAVFESLEKEANSAKWLSLLGAANSVYGLHLNTTKAIGSFRELGKEAEDLRKALGKIEFNADDLTDEKAKQIIGVLDDLIKKYPEHSDAVKKLRDNYEKYFEEILSTTEDTVSSVGDTVERLAVNSELFMEGLKQSGLRDLAGDTEYAKNQMEMLVMSMSASALGAEGIADALEKDYAPALEAINVAEKRNIYDADEANRKRAAIRNEIKLLGNSLSDLPALYAAANKAAISKFTEPYRVSQEALNISLEQGAGAAAKFMEEVNKNRAMMAQAEDLLGTNRSLQEMQDMAKEYRQILKDMGKDTSKLDGFFNSDGIIGFTENVGEAQEVMKAFLFFFIEALGPVEDAATSFDTLAESTRNLEQGLAQVAAFKSGGIAAAINVQELQEMDNALREVEASVKDWSDEQLQAQLSLMGYNVTVEEAREKYIALHREMIQGTKAFSDQESAMESLNNSIKDLVRDSANAENALHALRTGGVKALDKELKRAEVDKQVESIREEWDKLKSAADRGSFINDLRRQFNDATITADNFEKKIRDKTLAMEQNKSAAEEMRSEFENYEQGMQDVVKQQELYLLQADMMRQGMGSNSLIAAQDVQRAKDFAEAFNGFVGEEQQRQLAKWREIFPDLFKDAENFEADMIELFARQRMQQEWLDQWAKAIDEFDDIAREGFHSIFENGVDGFKDMIGNFKDMFKRMLIDMAYQAMVQPIMVQLGTSMTSAIGGLFGMGGGSGGSGSGSFANLSNLFTLKNLSSGIQNGLAGFGGNAMGALTGAGRIGTQALAKMGFQQASNAFSLGVSNFGMSMVSAGDSIGGFLGMQGMSADAAFGLGSLATAGAGWAGGRIGSDLGLALTGKQGSGWGATGGATIGAIAGSIVPGLGTVLGSALGGLVGGVVDSIFGSSAWNTTRGGIELGFGQEGFDPRAWTRQTKKGGLFSSTKRRFRYQDLDSETDSALNEVYDQTISQISSYYEAIGINISEASLEGVRVGSTLIGTSGKSKQSQEAIEEQITEWFVALSDTLVRSVDGSLDFAKLEELAVSLSGANQVLGTINMNLFDISKSGAQAAIALLDATGGLENLGAMTSAYYDKFFTEEEKLANMMVELTSIFDSLNLTMPDSHRGFRDIVESLDLTTAKGRDLFATMMGIAPIFDEMITAQDRLAESLNELRSQLDSISDELSNVISDGLLGKLESADVGARISDIIVGSIYDSLTSSYASQIANVMTDTIVQPMLTAITTGASVSQAVSGAAISNMVQSATQAASALGAILNNAEFRAAMEQIQAAIISATTPISGIENPTIDFGTKQLEAQRRAEEEALRLQESIASEKLDLEKQMLQLMGETNALRQLELNTIHPSNRELQERIWLIEDEMDAANRAAEAHRELIDELNNGVDEALQALRRSVDSEMDSVASAFDEASKPISETIRTLSSASSMLSRTLDSMRLSGNDVQRANRKAAQNIISDAIANGLPNVDVLNSALRDLSQPSENLFSSFTDYARDFLVTQNNIGRLLNETDEVLSVEEQTLQLLEDQYNSQIESLENIYKNGEEQVNALRGIDISVISVAEAVNGLTESIVALQQAQSSAPGQYVIPPSLIEDIVEEYNLATPSASNIISATQQASVYSSDDVVTTLKEAVEELKHLRAGNYQIAKNTKHSLDIDRKWDAIGLPPTRDGE